MIEKEYPEKCIRTKCQYADIFENKVFCVKKAQWFDLHWRPKVDYSKMYGAKFWDMPKIKDVIFNDPATIVFWADGTKTVVQCQDDDIFDPEKGLAMAISKKALGNKGNYCNEFKKWLPKKEEATIAVTIEPFDVDEMSARIKQAIKNIENACKQEKERNDNENWQ